MRKIKIILLLKNLSTGRVINDEKDKKDKKDKNNVIKDKKVYSDIKKIIL